MKVTIIVPVFNEAPILDGVLRKLFSESCPIDREWIIIDDYSTDGSSDILIRLKNEFSFLLITHLQNKGKGAAVVAGIQMAQGDFVIIQDADYEYDPKDIPFLLAPLIEDKADVVFGSRFKEKTTLVHRTHHYLVNKFLTTLSNFMSGIYLTDMETCYKIFRRDLVQCMNLQSQRFGIEVELTAYTAKTSARIFEIPIRYYPRTVLQGKKINWKDGVAAIFHLIRFNYFVSKKRAFKKLPEKYKPI